MLLAAHFAPSPGNIQPWRIFWRDNKLHIELRRDLTTSMDVKWRGAFVSLGAACLNAEIVAAQHSALKETNYFPEPDNTALAIQISLGKSRKEGQVTATPKELLPYLLTRSTNRHLTKRKEFSKEVIDELSKVVELYPVKLHLLSTTDQLEKYKKNF